MISEGQLIGVLTSYSANVDAFSENHRRVFEAVAGQCAPALRVAAELDGAVRHDPLTGLPNARILQETVDRAIVRPDASQSEATLMLIDIVRLREINSLYGREVGDEALRHVVEQARAVLRPSDVLFRYESDELIALVPNADLQTAAVVAQRIRHNVIENPLQLRKGATLALQVSIVLAATPRPGLTLREAMAAARAVTAHDRNDQSKRQHVH
jgi:diguanylate cyclase (GGDEF)-like protein